MRVCLKMKLLSTILILLITTPFIIYESLRFYTHFHECDVAHAQNALLLDNPLCSDPWQLHSHGPKQQAVCAKAKAENQVSVISCAWQHMWLRGEVYRIFTMITESYWMLLGFIVPCMLAFIYLWFWSSNERASRRDMLDMQREMYRETLQTLNGRNVQPPPQLLVQDYRREERYLEDDYGQQQQQRQRKRSYVQLISRDD